MEKDSNSDFNSLIKEFYNKLLLYGLKEKINITENLKKCKGDKYINSFKILTNYLNDKNILSAGELIILNEMKSIEFEDNLKHSEEVIDLEEKLLISEIGLLENELNDIEYQIYKEEILYEMEDKQLKTIKKDNEKYIELSKMNLSLYQENMNNYNNNYLVKLNDKLRELNKISYKYYFRIRHEFK